MTQTRDLDYFNALYAASEDPWHLRSGWYYQRKQDVLLAALPRPRYARSLQLGCDGGDLVAGLARRSDELLVADSDRDTVTNVRAHVAHLSNVEVRTLFGPEHWPAGSGLFDLVVLNDVGSRSDAATWAQLCHAVSNGLTEDATVLAWHYRQDLAGRTLQAATVHGMLESMLGLTKQVQISDADFIVDVWTTSRASVAEIDGVTAQLRG